MTFPSDLLDHGQAKPMAPPRPKPHLQFESAISGLVAGIDEVGRGPWAGPVVAAAVILKPGAIPPGINDSKLLGKNRRAALHDTLMALASVGVGAASVAEIDSMNILQASLLAMRRAFHNLPVRPVAALVDGLARPDLPVPVTAIVKGDQISLSIAAASIIAKVIRDRTMAALARKYPAYGWSHNAGYGTAEHRQALALVGISPHHRTSFAPIRHLLSEEI